MDVNFAVYFMQYSMVLRARRNTSLTFTFSFWEEFVGKKFYFSLNVLHSIIFLNSGIATSLLHSSFESWMIHEHKKLGYAEDLLDQTFQQMVSPKHFILIFISSNI